MKITSMELCKSKCCTTEYVLEYKLVDNSLDVFFLPRLNYLNSTDL